MKSRFSRCCKKSVKRASELAPVFEGDAQKQQNYLQGAIWNPVFQGVAKKVLRGRLN